MQRTLFNGPPSPEEFQRQLSEFMRQHFQSGQSAVFHKPQDADNAGTEEEPKGTADDILRFDRKPRDVKAYLDRFVIKQDTPFLAKPFTSAAMARKVREVLDG